MEKRYRQIIPGAVHNTILVFGDTPMVSYTHGLLILRMKNFSIMRWAVQRKAGRGMWVMDTKGGMMRVYQDGNAYLCADQVVGGFPEHGDNDFEESKAPTDKASTDKEYEDGINQDDDGTSIDNDDTLYRQQQQQQQSPQDHHYPLTNVA
eukprot:gene20599-27399_t